jgi:hypothetical protein
MSKYSFAASHINATREPKIGFREKLNDLINLRDQFVNQLDQEYARRDRRQTRRDRARAAYYLYLRESRPIYDAYERSRETLQSFLREADIIFTDPSGIERWIDAGDLVNRKGEFIGQDILTLIPDLQSVQLYIDECMQTTKAEYEREQNAARLEFIFWDLFDTMRANQEEYRLIIKELKQRIFQVDKEINTLKKGYNAPPLEAFE